MLIVRVDNLEGAKDVLTGVGIKLATKDELQKI